MRLGIKRIKAVDEADEIVLYVSRYHCANSKHQKAGRTHRQISAHKTGSPLRYRVRACMAALLAGILGMAPLVHAATATLYLQAPFDVQTGKFDLDDLEEASATPFSRSFSIPYATIEPLIRNQIKSVLDKKFSGTAVCDDLCPDVDYWVTFVADFAFTQKGQPVVQAFGNATENGVTVRFNAQAKIKLDVHVHAKTWFDSADVDIPIEVLLGLRPTVSATLWPIINMVDSDIHLTLDGSNVTITGLNGEAVQLGIELGTILGFTPLGLASGGPLAWGFLGAIMGNEGAEIAETKINSLIERRLELEITKANDLIEAEVMKFIDPMIAQANAVKDQILHTPLSGVDQSLSDLQNAWGFRWTSAHMWPTTRCARSRPHGSRRLPRAKAFSASCGCRRTGVYISRFTTVSSDISSSPWESSRSMRIWD